MLGYANWSGFATWSRKRDYRLEERGGSPVEEGARFRMTDASGWRPLSLLQEAAGESGVSGCPTSATCGNESCGPPVDPGLFVDANDLPVSLAAKLDFAGPSVETLDAY
jgi:hypothetical protein